MVQKNLFYLVSALGLIVLLTTPVLAHFGMIIPSGNIVTQKKKEVDLTLLFAHPFEGIGMDLVKPRSFSMLVDGKKTDLLPLLEETTAMNHQAWHMTLPIKRPGVYRFAMEPAPYWEEGEDIYIIHYTKTVISAYGGDNDWDAAMELPTEIIPLLRPFGNYAGNLFTGKVLLNGSPVPHSEIEVEFYNRDRQFDAPSEHHITQVIKADSEGVFSFTCPWKGWWGFSALNEADYRLKGPDDTNKSVELGAVLWIYLDSPMGGSSK